MANTLRPTLGELLQLREELIELPLNDVTLKHLTVVSQLIDSMVLSSAPGGFRVKGVPVPEVPPTPRNVPEPIVERPRPIPTPESHPLEPDLHAVIAGIQEKL